MENERKLMYIDVHAHLDFPNYDPDLDEVLAHCKAKGVKAIIVNGTQPQSNRKVLELAKKHEVEFAAVGQFNRSGRFSCKFKGKTVMSLDMDFLHKGVPQMKLKAAWKKPSHKEPDFACPQNLSETLKKLLARLNICSKEYIVRQYDHEVQAGSAVKPLEGEENDGPSDAGVVRPILSSNEGIVVSNGIIPRYSDIDSYWMAACSIDEAVRNAIATGSRFDYLAGLDNFCWCDPVASEKTPDGEYKLAQLVRANKALYDYTTAMLVPCISGKDSMKNDYMIGKTKISIPPTLLYSIVGKIDDANKAVTIDAKKGGDFVYVLGITKNELGASEYFAMHNSIGNSVPTVDFASAASLYKSLSSAIAKGFVASCHDCSDGGLGVALAETAFSGNLGMEIDLRKVPAEGVSRDDYLLFSESASRFVVTVSPKFKEDFERELRAAAAPAHAPNAKNSALPFAFAEIGKVNSNERIAIIGLSGEKIMDILSRELKEEWQKTMKW